MFGKVLARHKEIQYWAGMTVYMEGGHMTVKYARIVVSIIRQTVVEATLCRNGHKLEDHSTDVRWQDGEYAMTCQRCGKEFNGYW